MRLLCRLFGHTPNRKRVWNDNLDFRTRCRRCDAMMLRAPDRAWRLYDPAEDDLPGRRRNRHEPKAEV